MITKPNGATHSHSLGSIAFFYKKEGRHWMVWGKTKKWVRAMVNTVNTQANGAPYGFVELQTENIQNKGN